VRLGDEAAARSSAPSSGSSAPPAPPSTRAVSVAKYQPPLRISSAGPSAIARPVGEQHDAIGEGGGELGVVGGGPRRRSRPPRGRAGDRRARPSRRGRGRAWARRADRGRRLAAGAEHDGEREALPLAAGEVARVAVLADVEPGGGAGGRGASSPTRSCSR
jgi:hypothetical protein